MIRSSEKSLLISEDDTGFKSFVSELRSHLELSDLEWYLKVIKVPFSESFQTIYRRVEK